MEYFKNPDTWVTIATLLLSIIAIIISIYQTHLSNKQHLFDKRMDKYLLFRDLLYLYGKNRNTITKDDSIYNEVDCQFVSLTFCSKLIEINAVLDHPFQSEHLKIFLNKMDELEKNSVEIQLLWKRKFVIQASLFIKNYKKLLISMQKQYAFLCELKKQAITSEIFIEKAKQKATEIDLSKNISAINAIYNSIIIDDVEKKLFNSMKL